jgi:hypothetical protein
MNLRSEKNLPKAASGFAIFDLSKNMAAPVFGKRETLGQPILCRPRAIYERVPRFWPGYFFFVFRRTAASKAA